MTETKVHSVSIRFDAEDYNDIVAFASGDEIADTIRELVRRGLALANVPKPKSTQTLLRETKSRLENETLEAKLAITRKEWIDVAAVRAMLRKAFGLLRALMLQWAQSLEGLTDEQRRDLVKSVDDAMSQLRAMEPDGWEHGPINTDD